MKYLVHVTLEFYEEVEADSPETAEDLIRNMDWADIPLNITVDVEELDGQGEENEDQ